MAESKTSLGEKKDFFRKKNAVFFTINVTGFYSYVFFVDVISLVFLELFDLISLEIII